MACCAFALVILGQIAAGFVALRRAVPFALLGRPSDTLALNPATAWQLGADQPEFLPRFGWRTAGRAVAIAAVLELALIGAVAAWALSGGHASAHASLAENPDTIWCGRILP